MLRDGSAPQTGCRPESGWGEESSTLLLDFPGLHVEVLGMLDAQQDHSLQGHLL